MLPGGEGKSPNSIFDAKYAHHAFSALLRLMSQKGANERNLIAKIAGGAKMFSNEGISHPFALDIGERNTESIRLLLRHHQIPLISTDIGSDQGRWVWFHVSSGMLVVAKRSQKITL
jgi:chemotaxis protein CheD